MTGRAAAIQGGLAVAGLLAAHFTWQREPEHAPGSVTVIEAAKGDIGRIHYDDADNAVDLTRNGGGQTPVWIHLAPKHAPVEVRNPHEKAAPPPPPTNKATPPPRDLPGGDAAAKVFEQFAPLVSPRAFGVLDQTKLKELGLDAPKKTLEVTVKGDVRKYAISAPASTGSGEAFLRDLRDGRVYLMPRSLASDLANAAHLVDRRLHSFEPIDFNRIVVTAGGKKKEFVRMPGEPRANAGFAPAKTPDKADQMAKNWHDSVWRLFPADMLGRGEEPTGGKPAVAVRVDYFDGKDNVGWIELARGGEGGGEGMSTGEESAPGSDIYVRTEHTASWAKLGGGSGQLIADAQKLTATP